MSACSCSSEPAHINPPRICIAFTIHPLCLSCRQHRSCSLSVCPCVVLRCCTTVSTHVYGCASKVEVVLTTLHASACASSSRLGRDRQRRSTGMECRPLWLAARQSAAAALGPSPTMWLGGWVLLVCVTRQQVPWGCPVSVSSCCHVANTITSDSQPRPDRERTLQGQLPRCVASQHGGSCSRRRGGAARTDTCLERRHRAAQDRR